ncbi:hypothetical protein GUITHDRAFT_151131 [Guillardia theta CCMP2712]|uniref:Uncharacterized protein n=1 Tax=Guillardia theta (strain CCMP2712) TaxID=905079 RepID=L1JR20_GUITC|nr:hypothetical protein GUITHDRAFT_151131 [Guillardia theta CCMP2712]EKX51011.1 hypothetical protein GUITHDRAFT_151131 [Guillardia theta CCMP2712]|eukprot:XP_005837991.1 hypothetical protein GUITHDRAFT_151131 [Guillardia theta CCMP2712]
MFSQLQDMIFKFPSMHFPKFPAMHFPKFSAKDFAGGQATMSTTEFHCVNGTCDGKTITGKWKTPTHPLH